MKEAKHEKFITLRAIEGKSLSTIAKELDEDINTLSKWEDRFQNDIITKKAREYDKITETFKLTSANRLTYLCETYQRLQKEFNKRDFSGLPTDKIYYIMTEVYDLIESIKEENKHL
jgi:hypothetical protein